MKNIKETKKRILRALEEGEEKDYIVDFGSEIVTARSKEEAEEKALELIRNREIEIDVIEEN